VRTRALLATAAACLGLLAGGCGDEPADQSGAVPAAGELTPSGRTPGVPSGASYDVNGNEWLKLDAGERQAAASDFVADNPEDCKRADAGQVSDYADLVVGTDFPLTEPIAEALGEGCDVTLKSST
jgi:hypothetical protein